MANDYLCTIVYKRIAVWLGTIQPFNQVLTSYRVKKIDLLMVKSFAGPFVVAFGIALFVLIMQFLWLYIDEIAGKGVSILIMVELIAYLSVAVFPMALPIAVLISSVMVMGNLSERYELSSMKSAGVSLLRVLRPLMLISVGVGFFSYLCSDFLIPKANLQFKSRLHDIRRTKPTLSLEKGIFNEDFRNFVIRIGEKDLDGETIGEVQINDLTNSGMAINKIMADSGAMYTSDDRKFFVMELHKGTQYQQPAPDGTKNDNKYPFIRTNFKSWTKVWNLGEFDMNRSDEDRFKTQRSMLTMQQLRDQVDSINQQVVNIRASVGKDLLMQVDRLRQMTPSTPPQINLTASKDTNSASGKAAGVQIDSLDKQQGKNRRIATPMVSTNLNDRSKFPQQVITKPLDQYESIVDLFAESERKTLKTNAASTLRGHQNTLGTRKNQIKDRQKDSVKTAYELYSKYSFALVCIIFLFIGGPMGAIIRKGGFGYPFLVSIIFFVVFIFLTIMCRELAESFVMLPFAAAMVPCLVLIPIAIVLTYRSMTDRALMNTGVFDPIIDLANKLWILVKKKKDGVSAAG